MKVPIYVYIPLHPWPQCFRAEGRQLAHSMRRLFPVLSYYEFKHPMEERLIDEARQEILVRGLEPDRPEWIGSYYGGEDYH